MREDIKICLMSSIVDAPIICCRKSVCVKIFFFWGKFCSKIEVLLIIVGEVSVEGSMVWSWMLSWVV